MSEMSNKAWAGTVFFGCMAGIAVVGCLFSLAILCALCERTVPGSGWALACAITLGAAWVLRMAWRVLSWK